MLAAGFHPLNVPPMVQIANDSFVHLVWLVFCMAMRSVVVSLRLELERGKLFLICPSRMRGAPVKLPVCFAFEMSGVDDGGPGTLKLFNGWPWWPRFGASTDNPGAYVTLGLLQDRKDEQIYHWTD